MKCGNCNHENSYTADFCHACGHPFTDEQREAAYAATIGGRITKLEDAYSWITLSKITGSRWFKIGALLLVLLTGIMNLIRHPGLEIQLKDSYRVEYNRNDQEYYVYFNDMENRNLYLDVPAGVDEVYYDLYDSEGNQVVSGILNGHESFLIREDVYTMNIEARNGEKVKSAIRVIVY